MDSKVSIIIPLYNAESTIKSAVESCLNQSYSDVEVIVIDDGSTDCGKQSIASYITSGKIQYFYQSNRGRSAARNFGLDIAKGTYINFLDSDDLLHKEKIKTQIGYMERNDSCFATYSAARYFEDKSNRLISVVGHEYKQKTIYNDLLKGHFIPIQSVLFRKSAVRFDEDMNAAEDWAFFISLFENKEIIYIDEILSSVRITSQYTKEYQLHMRRAQIRLLFALLRTRRDLKSKSIVTLTLIKYLGGFLLERFSPAPK